MRRILLFKFILALLSGTVFAQTGGVSGKVLNPDGTPMPGVSVFLKGTSTGTITDAEGRYSIPATSGTLVFTFIGYKPVEATIPASASADVAAALDITMEEDTAILDELVVVGYGSQQKKNITGAVAVVGKEAMESRPNSQFGNLIQGKTAGVQVISGSGKPSAGFTIRIRGANGIEGGADALYVVDGVISSDTRTINPADIENITVLKDAGSTAIYGARGANGVVLITTKQGSTVPKFEFNAYTGMQTPWRKLKVLNSEQYRDLMTEMGYLTDWSQYTANTDWQNKVFQNGQSQNYQFSASGKTEKTSYYMSAGWMKQEGIIRTAEMDRYNFKVNLKQFVNDWLAVGTNINYMQYHDVDVSDNTNVNSGGVILGMLSTPPNIGVYNPNGTFTRNPFQDWENPISGTDGSDRDYNQRRILGNIYLELDPIEGLQIRTSVGIDNQSGVYDYFLDPFRTSYGRAKVGIARNTTDFNSYLVFENTATYQKSFGKHNTSVMIGAIAEKFRWENANIETNGFSSTSVTTTNGGSIIVAAANRKDEKTNASFISRINYDYEGKYLATFNFRRDGSAAFGPNNRWGNFPSLTLGWRFTQEEFFPETIVNDAKLRVGWGQTGSDMSAYSFMGLVGLGANYPIGGVVQPGNYPQTLSNYSLKWATTTQTNIGLDVSLWNSRVTVTLDAYMKKTTDLLLEQPLPKTTGYDAAKVNAGELENKGIEFMVSSSNLNNGELKWTTDFNISFNRNKVTDIYGSRRFEAPVNSRSFGVLNIEGQPLGRFYGYVFGGVDPATGNAYYITEDGDGNTTTTFTPSADTDRKFIGNPNPDFIYGLTNTLNYKGFSLSIFLQGSQGNDILNLTKIELESMTDPKNQSHSVLKRWRNPGDQTNIPRATPNNTDNSRLSTRFVEDGSYMRVKALTLAYNVPTEWVKRVKMTSLKLYATGENLFTFTDYSGFDPEVNSYGGSNSVQGVDYGTYPQARTLILGLNVTF